MGQPIAARGSYSSAELLGLAKRSRDADQARRLLSIAAVVDGALRAAAAQIGGMDRQTLRDWVHRFNEAGCWRSPTVARAARRNGGRTPRTDRAQG